VEQAPATPDGPRWVERGRHWYRCAVRRGADDCTCGVEAAAPQVPAAPTGRRSGDEFERAAEVVCRDPERTASIEAFLDEPDEPDEPAGSAASEDTPTPCGQVHHGHVCTQPRVPGTNGCWGHYGPDTDPDTDWACTTDRHTPGQQPCLHCVPIEGRRLPAIEYGDDLIPASEPTVRARVGACSCRPAGAAIHQRGSYCGDTQYEEVVDAVRAATGRPGDERDEDAVAAVLAHLARPSGDTQSKEA
jgi:hypothetical protein